MKLLFFTIFINLVCGYYSVIQSDSYINYFGSHPMHAFSGSSSSIMLLSDCNKANDVCDLIFKVPIISLNSGNDNRYSNMLSYLSAFSYPEIILSIQNFTIKEYNEDFISCELSIGGVGQQIEIPLSLHSPSKDQYKAYSFFTISLDEFNIDIPKLLFLPIHDEIKVEFDILIES